MIMAEQCAVTVFKRRDQRGLILFCMRRKLMAISPVLMFVYGCQQPVKPLPGCFQRPDTMRRNGQMENNVVKQNNFRHHLPAVMRLCQYRGL